MCAAPVAWAIATQLGQILPYTDCLKQTSSSFVAVAAGLVIAVASVAVSYIAQNSTSDRIQLFVTRLSIGISLAFTFALVLQGVATLLVSACER
jgi:hypothetical protein